MRKSFGGFALLLLLTGVAMTVFAAYQVANVPDVLEYVTPADPDAPGDNAQGATRPTALKQMIDSMEEYASEIEKVASIHTVWGFASGVTAVENGQEDNAAEVSLTALGSRYTRVYPMFLLSGRLFFEDELKYGDRVALLDEQLSFKMFQSSDPIDREIVVQGQKYRVVGVVRHKKGVGDAAEYGLYVPLVALARHGGQRLDQVIWAAVPEQGAGALQAMESISRQWRPKGTLHDTRKEKQSALLVPRWVSGMACAFVLVGLAGWLQALGKKWVLELKARLRLSYMAKLIPWTAMHALAWLVMLGALLGGVYLLCIYMVQPILSYPEWVPAVPVEIEEIAKTFWNLQWMSNAPMELRTPNVLRLRHFGNLAGTGVIVVLLGLLCASVNKYFKARIDPRRERS